MRKIRAIGIAVVGVLLTLPVSAGAIPYDFSVTFNGSAASVDVGSDPIAGTNLLVGDTYALDIHAAGNDWWFVPSLTNLAAYATFFVLPGGTRNGNIMTTFLLDGVAVATDNENLNQANVHIGPDSITLGAGLLFDQVIVNYALLSSTIASTIIQPTADVVAFSPFFRSSSIQYQQGPPAVPEPATTTLVGTGLAALAARGLRRRKASR